MNGPIETVQVIRPDAPGGYVVINRDDLKPEDVIYGQEEQTPTKKRGKKK